MKRRFLFLVLGLTIAGGAVAFAQDMDGVSIDAINKRAAELKAEAAVLVGIAQENVNAEMPNVEGDIEAAKTNAATADISGIDGIEAGDFDALLKGRAAQSQQGLVVFVSLSMPKESLRKVILDTSNAGGIILFRGFPGNSMQQFRKGLAGVLEKDDPVRNIGIDPRMFQAFNIEAVPTYVAYSKPLELCSGLDCVGVVPEHDIMRGNIPLGYVLEEFASGGGPGASVARTALLQMEMK
jgi:conjugal transfer pilus assembly protein TrbC